MKSKIFLLLGSLIFLFITSYYYRERVFSQHFVDEEDNLVLGSYLLKNEKLYKDLFSHHQPLSYILSAGIQKATNPNSIYLLIKRHREAIILWSIIWSVFLITRLGFVFLPFLLIFEVSKFFLFGDMFLSESLVIYPLIYLTSLIFILKIHPWEYLLVGIILGLCIYLLAPVWPLLFVILIFLIIKEKKERLKKTNYIFWGLTLASLLILPFISMREYFFYSIYTNFKYYIPLTSEGNFALGILKSFISPFLSFNSAISSETGWIIKLLSVTLLFNYIALLKSRQTKIVALILLILGLGNIRFVTPGTQEYNGFHILPWFALLIFTTCVSTFLISSKLKKVSFSLLIICVVASFYLSKDKLFIKRDLGRDYYVNYSVQEDMGRAINIMKDKDDKLFVAPDEWLVYWQADIDHRSFLVNYYAWMEKVPYLKDEARTIFDTNPPTFLYTNRVGTGLEQYYDRYIQVRQFDKPISLFVRPERWKNLSESQKDQLKYFNFEVE